MSTSQCYIFELQPHVDNSSSETWRNQLWERDMSPTMKLRLKQILIWGISTTSIIWKGSAISETLDEVNSARKKLRWEIRCFYRKTCFAVRKSRMANDFVSFWTMLLIKRSTNNSLYWNSKSYWSRKHRYPGFPCIVGIGYFSDSCVFSKNYRSWKIAIQ